MIKRVQMSAKPGAFDFRFIPNKNGKEAKPNKKDSDKVKECREKLKKEQMVLDGAVKMLQIATPNQKNMVEMSIIESKRRLEFLEGEMKRLQIRKVSIADPEQNANLTTLEFTETRIGINACILVLYVDYLLFNTTANV